MAGADDCGCCAGTSPATPAAVENPPGLAAIAYRSGRHPDFKESLLARLASSASPALGALRARTEDDFTIAFCDAFAVMADVLTFYQERLANESYLRTATERRSVLELARLIGYTLAPGVAASTYLAFTLQDAPGVPELGAKPVMIPVGTRVQSVPGPDEQPQTFETTVATAARVEWNAVPAQVSTLQQIGRNTHELYLLGIDAQLQKGDAIAIVGDERRTSAASERWSIRLVDSIESDTTAGVTRLILSNELAHLDAVDQTAFAAPRIYVFRQRAALFGHNAPDPNLLSTRGTGLGELTDTTNGHRFWLNFSLDDDDAVDLDAAYQKIVPGSWFALQGEPTQAAPAGRAELFRANAVSFPSRSDFSLSAKITRLAPDTDTHVGDFHRRSALVLAQSEELAPAERPLKYPVFGNTLTLARLVPGLAPGQAAAISGKAPRIIALPLGPVMHFSLPGAAPIAVETGDTFRVVAAPARVLPDGQLSVLTPEQLAALLANESTTTMSWTVADAHGRVGTLLAPASAIALAPPRKDDHTIHELVFLDSASDAVADDGERTTLRFGAALRYCYERSSVRLCANVAPATHGETVGEIAGSGNAAQPNQRFLLKQAPLTYVSAATPSGRESTLEVRVNDLLWREVPTLFARGPGERVYTARTDDDGRTAVQFGDGAEGARPSSGQDNIRLRYRKGTGSAGNVGAGQLSNLLTRPLGVNGVTNPDPTSGGQDPEALTAARRNAPLTVLTLERAVSVRDYEDFARSFAGIAKVHGVWIAMNGTAGVFLTIAGPAGAAIPAYGDTRKSLLGSLRQFGDPLLPLAVETYTQAHFRLRASIKVAGDALAEKTLAVVEAVLRERFGFEQREFGQPVTIDEVYAVIQGVEGVEAVLIEHLYRASPNAWPTLEPRLFAALPIAANDAIAPAELLTLDPGPLQLGVMI
jgi:hypothetical protein